MKSATRERAEQLFGALANSTRLRIVERLRDGGKTVNEITAELGTSQSGTSQHLSVLTRAGVLVMEPRGATRLYRIRGPRILRILDLIEEFCDIHGLYGEAEETDIDTAEMPPEVAAPLT